MTTVCARVPKTQTNDNQNETREIANIVEELAFEYIERFKSAPSKEVVTSWTGSLLNAYYGESND